MLIILIYLDEMIDDIDRNIQCWIDDAVIENLHQIRKEEAKNQRRIHEEEEENQCQMEAQCPLDESEERCQQEAIQMEADLQVVMDEEECNCIKAAWRAHLREVAYQMRDLSVMNYLLPQMQLQCIMQDWYSLADALTMGGDHCTPCRECIRNDPDECFWFVTTINLSLDGRMMTRLRNNEIRHSLYCIFIIDEYSYLHEAQDNTLMGHVGLPQIPIPTCVEREIKWLFPNEDGRPFVGFWRRGNRGQRNRNRPNIWSIKYKILNVGDNIT